MFRLRPNRLRKQPRRRCAATASLGSKMAASAARYVIGKRLVVWCSDFSLDTHPGKTRISHAIQPVLDPVPDHCVPNRPLSELPLVLFSRQVSCGTCGGSGCGRLDGGNDSCCMSAIKDSGRLCSSTGEAPCIVDPGTVLREMIL